MRCRMKISKSTNADLYAGYEMLTYSTLNADLRDVVEFSQSRRMLTCMLDMKNADLFDKEC